MDDCFVAALADRNLEMLELAMETDAVRVNSLTQNG
jgi:hypothetical protein